MGMSIVEKSEFFRIKFDGQNYYPEVKLESLFFNIWTPLVNNDDSKVSFTNIEKAIVCAKNFVEKKKEKKQSDYKIVMNEKKNEFFPFYKKTVFFGLVSFWKPFFDITNNKPARFNSMEKCVNFLKFQKINNFKKP